MSPPGQHVDGRNQRPWIADRETHGPALSAAGRLRNFPECGFTPRAGEPCAQRGEVVTLLPDEALDPAWNDLGRGLTRHGPQAKSGSLPVFVSKVLLGHSYALAFIGWACFPAAAAESSSCDRLSGCKA